MRSGERLLEHHRDRAAARIDGAAGDGGGLRGREECDDQPDLARIDDAPDGIAARAARGLLVGALRARGPGMHEVDRDALTAELVDLNVDVIMAFGDEAIVAAKKTTSTIPIVMFACDALAVGFVTNLARPVGNVTGVTCVTTEMSLKRIALLREAVPRASRVGILFNPANVSKPPEADRTRTAAQGLGLKVQTEEVLERADIERAFSAFMQQRSDVVLVLDEAFIFIHSKLIAELAIKHRLPTVHTWRQSVMAGGLMSYGPSQVEMLSIATSYVDKILKGAKPADLPVEQPTKFELVINEKTAKALGLTIPPSLLLRADEVLK